MLQTETSAFPTNYIAQLLPGLHEPLTRLGQLVAADRSTVIETDQPVNHVRVLEAVEAMVRASQLALGFFFAHPSQRLWKVLDYFATESARMVEWLAARPPTQADSRVLEEYQACCERIQSAARDWQLAIRLTLLEKDINEEQPETLH